MSKRDLAADLKLCETATPGPWVCRVVEDGIRPRVFVTRKCGVEVPPKFYIAFLPDMCHGDSEADAQFIAAAREGWPEAIKRAMEAEARVAELKARLARLKRVVAAAKRVSAKKPFYFHSDWYRYCWYCGSWEGDGHKAECPWVALREALGIEDEGAGAGNEQNGD